VWGTGDEFFGVEWARWLAATIPGARSIVEVDGARLFFPLERPEVLNRELRALWTEVPVDAGDRSISTAGSFRQGGSPPYTG
jgi:hypothetical protein